MVSEDLDARIAHLCATEGRNSNVYPKFAEAFRRLASVPQRPVNHPEFIEMADEGRHIKVTITNIALEADVNPQRFTGQKSDFKLMSALVKSYRPTMGVSENTTAKLERQAETINELQQQLVAARSRIAVEIIAKDTLAAELDDIRRQNERLKARAA